MKLKMEYKITEKFTQERIDELLRIHKEKGLTAENLIEEAKNKNNLLHDLFEWDNRYAGKKWRLAQARFIINEVKVIINTKEIPAFEIITNVSTNEAESQTLLMKNNGKAYEPIVEILTDKEKRNQLLRQAIIHIDYWKNQYTTFNELKPIFASIEKIKKKLNIKH